MNLKFMAGRTVLVLKKFSPEIMLVSGIVGVVTGTVIACKATLKVEEIQEKHEDELDKIETAWTRVENGEIAGLYSESDYKKDKLIVRTKLTVDIVKLYTPAVIVSTISIGLLIGSHGIMKKRNIAVVAAYKAIEEGFNAYRKRVIDDYGEDVDYMYRNGLETTKIKVDAYTDADGVKHKSEEKTVLTNVNDPSMYAKFFDESCTQWTKDAQYNYMFINAQQRYYNNLLLARGHVFLNEVYDGLGLERTTAGAAVGWVLGQGDSHIDFGIFDTDGHPKKRDFVNGLERSILLDFNVDGVIWNLI